MGPPQEKTLTHGDRSSPMSLPWKDISDYPSPPKWESGPKVLLAIPCVSEPSGFFYGVGCGTLEPEYHSNEMRVIFRVDCDTENPTHYLPLYPPGQ